MSGEVIAPRATTLEPFTLTAGPSPAARLSVLAFRGREAVSRPFRFDLTVAVPENDVPELEERLLGHRAVLGLETTGGEARSVCGMVARLAKGLALDHRARAVRLTLVPRLWRLSQRVTSRIFQDKTVPQIVAAVLDEAAVPHRSTLVTKYARRRYCVQHRESDLAFVTRLLGEEGIWYFFDHGHEETVVLADSVHLYPPISGDPRLVVRERRPDDARLADERDVFRFEPGRALASGAVLHRDHDFRRPGIDLRVKAPAATSGAFVPDDVRSLEAELAVYDHGEGEDEGPEVDPSAAGVRLAQLQRRAVTAKGRSACRRLVPGLRFELADDALDARDESYAITSVAHEGHAADLSDSGEPRYENHFVCVPAALGLRPKRPRRVLQQVTETARVVGPEGQEIYTDELGRVKVQFHWDLDRKKRSEHSSCWLRVATPWAGAGWGAQFVPRVGMDVLVTFLSGDVDRPIVLGCLYNGANRPPFALPGGCTKSGILTRSSPRGTGGSELSFDDAVGREQVTLRAERDLLESTARDREQSVGGDEHVTVMGRATAQIRGDKIVEVGGTFRESAGGRSSCVQGDVAESIGGRCQAEIGQSHLLTVGRDQVVCVAGSSDLIVGTPGRSDHHAVTVLGDAVLSATSAITLRAADAVRIACGESIIELTPEGVRITGKRVELAGAERAEIRGNGPVLTLAGDAQLAAMKVRLFAEHAKIVLDTDAKIEGAFVKLNSPDEPTLSTGAAPPPETQPFKLKLSDAEYGVWADKRYQLHVDGLTFDGTTDVEGFVDKRIPKTATSVSLVVWLGDYPTGPTKTRTIHLGALALTRTPRGAAERLTHLGYYRGEPADTVTDALRAAMRDFQDHAGLSVTGVLDASTVAKLDALHGA